MDIRWESPPEEALLRQRGANGKYLDFAIAIRERVGEWAILPSDGIATVKSARGTAQNIRNGKTAGFAKGEYEAVAHDTTIYVRFTGPVVPKEAVEGDEDGDHPPSPADNSDEARLARAAQEFASRARIWAKDNGLEINDRGRMPREIIEKYARETGQLLPAAYRRQ